MILIALTGHMRAGKSTVAEYLVKRHSFLKFALATPIKELIKSLDLPLERKILQHVGNCMRQIDEDVWLKAMWKRLKPFINEGKNIVIEDVRLLHEAEYFKTRGFEIIKINASNEIRKKRAEQSLSRSISWETWKEWHEDPTEKEVDQIIADRELLNESTPEELFKQVDNLLLQINEM